MANKRKYPEVVGHWVYSIKVPSVNKYYIGVSKQQCYERWKKTQYESSSLQPYLNEWDSMEKTVLVDNLTKEQAYQYEGKIIDALSMNNLCINNQRSGLIEVSDINGYMRELYKNNAEYQERQKQRTKQYEKQHYQNDAEYREQKKQRCKQYYEDNKEQIKEKRRQRYQKKKLEKQLNK
jgi:hypothetical protein